MKIIWLVLAACLMAASGATAQTCTLTKMASLDMLDGPDNRIFVQVSINGSPHKFLLDTGGVYSEISEPIADALGLHKSTVAGEIYAVDGTRYKYGAIVSSFMLGQNEAKNFHMLIAPQGEGVDGVLAPDILQVFDVELDFAAKKVNLFSQDHCEGKVVYWAKEYSDADFKLDAGYHIEFLASLDGRSNRAVFDTGSVSTWLSSRTAGEIYGLDENSPGMEKTEGTLGDKPIFRRTFQTLAVSGIEVRNPQIHIEPDAAEEAFRRNHPEKDQSDPIYGVSLNAQPLTFGMNIISKLHVYIAYKEHKLYVTAADAH